MSRQSDRNRHIAIGIGAAFGVAIVLANQNKDRGPSHKSNMVYDEEPDSNVPPSQRMTVKGKAVKPGSAPATAPPPVKKTVKPPTKKQLKAKAKVAKQKRRAANRTPEARAARLQKTSMALDFMQNIASSASSAAGNFKK